MSSGKSQPRLSASGAIKAGRPAQQAKDSLSVLLGRVQDIRDPSLDLESLSAAIAHAVRHLYAVETSVPDEAAHSSNIVSAMDNCRKALQALQDLKSEDPVILEASSVIARVLAMLYPISRVQQKQKKDPGRPPSIVHGAVSKDARRSHQRIRIEADIGVQSESNFFTGFTEDISRGGMFVATYDIRPVGSQVSLSFTLPSGHLVVAEGVVRWVREYNDANPEMYPGMGVQFTDLNTDDNRAIQQFFTQRAPLFYEE